MLSQTEENYLKAIFTISLLTGKSVSTNNIAEKLKTKASSVTDMIKKLSEKKLVDYKKYKGTSLTSEGENTAVKIVRKHRLWEVFLVEKLKFNWDEVHEIAEQLEHIRSPLLISRLDEFLAYPQYDPHGDPIPDKNGIIHTKPRVALSKLNPGESGKLISVNDTNDLFLKYLDKVKISIGCQILVKEKFEYDGSFEIMINNQFKLSISETVADNLLISM